MLILIMKPLSTPGKSKEKLSYLDVLVSIKDNRISTDVYCKQTETHQYLDSKSCHPRHVKNGIPYGQSLRVRRICNSDEVFDKRLKELKGQFVNFRELRGFKKNMNGNQFEKAKAKRRENLLYQNTNRNKQVKWMS